MGVISPGWYVLAALAATGAVLSPLLLPARYRFIGSGLAMSAFTRTAFIPASRTC